MKKTLLIILSVITSIMVYAQNAPALHSLIQANTQRGSYLNFVETTDSGIYYTGTINKSETPMDGVFASNVGLYDLFVIKNDPASGNTIYSKTFNAGASGKITPTYMMIDNSNNAYIVGTFTGTMTYGGKSISSADNESFILKLSSGGDALWIAKAPMAISATNIKGAADSTDLFFVCNTNTVLHFNNLNGSLVSSKTYNSVYLRDVAINNGNLYIAGQNQSDNNTIGNVIIQNYATGFVLAGNKNEVFTSSVQLSGRYSIIVDVAFRADGSMLLSGFSRKASSFDPPINIILSTGQFAYTYDSNTTSSTKYFIAAVNNSFTSVQFYRTGTEISSPSSLFRDNNITLTPNSTSNNFRATISTTPIGTIYNSNATTSSAVGSGIQNWTISCNANGAYQSGLQTAPDNNMLSASGTYISKTAKNIRVFTSDIYNAVSGAKLYTKTKTSSNGGSISRLYHHYLKSTPTDMFVTMLAEGKANFFGKSISNISGSYSRIFARVDQAGQAKWIAKFHQSSTRGEQMNYSFSCMDKQDNSVTLVNTTTQVATLFDAGGNSVDFSAGSKAVIKLDKNGMLLWSREISGNLNASVITDNNDDVIISGQDSSGFNVMKLDKNTGATIFSKTYPNIYVYGAFPVVDSSNNLYIFTEAYPANSTDLNFDGITIVDNNGSNNIMLKFNSSGTVIMGKNFYAKNDSNYSYAWPNAVIFDGNDFIMNGTFIKPLTQDYIGLSGSTFTSHYPNESYIPMLAKISPSGDVVWEKPIFSSRNSTGNYVNIDIDENRNIYLAPWVSDRIVIDNIEYSYDANNGNRVIEKFNTNGTLQYIKSFDKALVSYPIIDVVKNDVFSISGFTNENDILSQTINNLGGSNLYIASFGDPSLATNEQNFGTKLSIAPNPVKDILNIKTEAVVKKVEIYSATGQILKTITTKESNVSELTKGVYIVKIYTENGSQTQKIIKE